MRDGRTDRRTGGQAEELGILVVGLALGLNAIKLKFDVFNYSDEIERVTHNFFQFELNIW